MAVLRPAPANALDGQISIIQYLHTKWTLEDGNTPPYIQTLAQSSDGYLWLGTQGGLHRFDGLRFSKFEPAAGEALPSTDIRILISSSRGGIWVWTLKGLCRVDQGHVTRFQQADTVFHGNMLTMFEDAAGDLWSLNREDRKTFLAVLRVNGLVQVFGEADGLPDFKLNTIFRDKLAGLWLGTDHGLCRWQPGIPAICPENRAVRADAIVQGESGEILVHDAATRTLFRYRDGEFRPVEGVGSQAVRSFLRDQRGSIWLGTVGQGLLRIRNGQVERYQHKDGLSSDVNVGLLEDREGNVWVATVAGLDRFRNPELIRISSRDGLPPDPVASISIMPDATAWIGTLGGGLSRYGVDGIQNYSLNSGLPSPTVLSSYADRNGRLWTGTVGGLAYLSGNKFVEVPGPGGGHLFGVYGVTGNSSGAVYAVNSKLGVMAVRDGKAVPVVVHNAAGKRIYRLYASNQGELWIGFYEGGIVRLKEGSEVLYGPNESVAPGPVQSIYEDAEGSIWLGTGQGLSRFRHGIWTTWTSRHGLPEGAQSMVEDSVGNLWVLSQSGLLRFVTAELRAVPDGAPQTLKFSRFGKSDAIRQPNRSSMNGPSIHRAHNGSIWITTDEGVAIVDPARIQGNPVAPTVMVEQMLIDGKPVDLRLPQAAFRGGDLQIAYNAVSMAAPEGVRFKYWLEGFDHAWTDAGARRNVDYVHLPPASYRFHVIASNNDGVWNSTGVAMNFQLTPYFYQTWWFAVSCASALALLVWFFHLLHIRRVVLRFQLAAQERTRVTRELHDSLLQGFSGVVYQLEAAARQFDTNRDLSRQKLNRAIDQADEALLETRRTLMSLRIPALENQSLPEALAEAGTRLTQGASVTFHINVKGRVRLLGYDEQANLYLIGREAITNAVNHASAHKIATQLTYSGSVVRLTVRDDGTGFDVRAHPRKEDHWGLASMQERAKGIGATFKLDSGPGLGTTVEVTVERRRGGGEPLRLFLGGKRRDTISN